MTTERWTDDMLDRLVSTVANLAGITEQNTQSITRLDNNVDRLVNVSNDIITELQRQGEEIRELRTDMLEMQSEVRGLQTENRRILDQLINRDNEENN
jgi:predicted  nucleic acid-binding Zn-ribbon protein